MYTTVKSYNLNKFGKFQAKVIVKVHLLTMKLKADILLNDGREFKIKNQWATEEEFDREIEALVAYKLDNKTMSHDPKSDKTEKDVFNKIMSENPELFRIVQQAKATGDKSLIEDYLSKNPHLFESYMEMIAQSGPSTMEEHPEVKNKLKLNKFTDLIEKYKLGPKSSVHNMMYWDNPQSFYSTAEVKPTPSMGKIIQNLWNLPTDSIYPNAFYWNFPDVAYWAIFGEGNSHVHKLAESFGAHRIKKLEQDAALNLEFLDLIISKYISVTGRKLECID